jgi:hypothetical protein
MAPQSREGQELKNKPPNATKGRFLNTQEIPYILLLLLKFKYDL